jgi:hypothetical protein
VRRRLVTIIVNAIRKLQPIAKIRTTGISGTASRISIAIHQRFG